LACGLGQVIVLERSGLFSFVLWQLLDSWE
jgi:hypothetical protein